MLPKNCYRLLFLLPVLPLALLIPSISAGQGVLSGQLVASPESSQPDLGSWEYTLTVQWDTGSELGLLSLSLYLDELSRGCTCGELQMAVVPSDTVGFSTGIPARCPVYYDSTFDCFGDPILPVTGQMFRMTPFVGQYCEPDSIGEGIFTFFSFYAPVEVESSQNLFLVNEWEEFAGAGTVTGAFPGLPCDPLHEEQTSWGCLKSRYSN